MKLCIIVALLFIAGSANCLLKNTIPQAVTDVCAAVGVPFTLASVKLSLCVNDQTSQQVDTMLGNFVVALPCILDGNQECLEYAVKLKCGDNFRNMGTTSAGNTVAVNMFNEMGGMCDAAEADVAKAASSMEVTSRICKLVGQLTDTIKSSGVANCPLLPNALKLVNAVAILKPENLRSILNPNALKNLLNIKNLLI